MKIKGHIYRVEDNGDSLVVTAQGTAAKAPEWMESMSSIEIKMPNTKTNVKSFHIGRKIEIEVRPK
jgi:hypothetical protein